MRWRIAGARWRSVVAVLWLFAGPLPFLVPPRPADPLPDCCWGDGAHKCSLRKAENSPTVVTVPCNAPRPKAAVSGANLTALHPVFFHERALYAAPGETLPHPVDRVPSAAFGSLSSRAPPHLV